MVAQEASVIFMHIMRALRMYICISQMPLDLRACRMTKKLVPACLSICILYVCLCFRWQPRRRNLDKFLDKQSQLRSQEWGFGQPLYDVFFGDNKSEAHPQLFP